VLLVPSPEHRPLIQFVRFNLQTRKTNTRIPHRNAASLSNSFPTKYTNNSTAGLSTTSPTMYFPTAIAVLATAASAAALPTNNQSANPSSLARRAVAGKSTFYGGNVQGGTCSFSTYKLPAGLYGTAFSGQVWDSAANCGGCVKVSHGGKSIVAMVRKKKQSNQKSKSKST
jgi:hypothetical protein